MLVPVGLDHLQGQRGIDQAQLVHGLLDQLIAVGQDERPPPAPLHQQGEDDGFARAGRQDEQRPLHPARGGREERGHRFVLIGPWSQAKCRWGSDSVHREASLCTGREFSTRSAPRHYVPPFYKCA